MKEKQKGILALILLTTLFSCLALVARYLGTDLLLFQQVYLRILAAFVLGLIVFNKSLNFTKLKHITVKEWLILLTRAISMYLFAVTLVSQANIEAKLSNVAFIGALPLTAVVGYFLLKDKLTFPKIILLLTGFGGTLLVAVKDYSQIWIWGRGEFFALLSAIFFSLSYVLARFHSKLLNNQEISEIIFGLGFILVFATSLIKGDGLPVNSLNLNIILVILLAGGFNILYLLLTNYGFRKVEIYLASNILTLEALFTIILAFIFYHELPNLKETIGGLIILASVVGMNELERREK